MKFWIGLLLLSAAGLSSATAQNIVTHYRHSEGFHSHGQIYDPQSGTLLIFGGSPHDGPTNRLLQVLNAAADEPATFSLVSPTGTPPPPCMNPQALLDPTTNRMIVFGGTLGREVWILLNATNGGQREWIKPVIAGGETLGYIPTAAYVPSTNRAIAVASAFNETWILSNANAVSGTPTWTKSEATGAGTSVLTYDSVSNRAIGDGFALLNANGIGGSPRWEALVRPVLLGITGWTSAYDHLRNRLMLFGRANQGGDHPVVLTYANGLGGTPEWSHLANVGAFLTSAKASFDPVRNRVIHCGGLYDLVSDLCVVIANPSGFDAIVESNTPGTTAIVDGRSITSTTNFAWRAGTQHTLEALDAFGNDLSCNGPCTLSKFANWSGNAAKMITVTALAENVTYTANYQQHYRVRSTVRPANAGAVSIAGSDDYHPNGQVLAVTGTPNPGFRFQGPQTVTVNGITTVSATFVPCNATVSTANISLSAVAEIASAAYTVDASCAGKAVSNDPWITVRSLSPAIGAGRVAFQVQPNTGTAARTGFIDVMGAAIRIVQASAACNLTLTPPNTLLTSAAANLQVGVQTGSNCQYAAPSSSAWLSIPTAPTITGSAQVPVSAAANDTTQFRAASITIAGNQIPFLQMPPNPTARFTDVPTGHGFFGYIEALARAAIISGCTASMFCPDQNTTRGQIAVFLVRGILGTDQFQFPTQPYFTDVPSTHPFFRYVQKIRELNLTSGCAADRYCPDDLVTRGQMSALLIRARLNLASGDTFPFLTTPSFTDISSTHVFFSFIQKMKQLGITAGCTATSYCDALPVTRAQMAVFVVRAFLTP